MSGAGRAAHMPGMYILKADRVKAAAPAVPDHERLLDSTSDVLIGHRDKITAGVPGCLCGKTYPEGSFSYFPILHAQHLADVAVRHVLEAAAAAVHADQEDYAAHPTRWGRGGHDSDAALEAINQMVRHKGHQAEIKETATV